ncbi:hypothetical protein [Bradyrhizobium sp. S69]|uniref:hypothetical protein n=1 Tax=Bradyrhizobium sp. S69 TaxID=1641856 RepID=UPI00131B757F|nr:hypothetical protein [Bradyrhizobium sp. S69]
MSEHPGGRSEPSDEPPHRNDGENPRPVSDRGLAVFLVILAVALVTGYLFVNKLADMSHQEDCALARRHNC